MKRRSFIKNTLFAGSIGLLPSCKSSAIAKVSTSKVDKKMTSPLGIALVGLGDYSTTQLAPALLRTKHCKLTGIVTGSPEKIPVWQKEYGIKDSNVYNYKNMGKIAVDQTINPNSSISRHQDEDLFLNSDIHAIYYPVNNSILRHNFLWRKLVCVGESFLNQN